MQIIAFHILRDGTVYQGRGGDFFDRLHPARTTKRLSERLQRQIEYNRVVFAGRGVCDFGIGVHLELAASRPISLAVLFRKRMTSVRANSNPAYGKSNANAHMRQLSLRQRSVNEGAANRA